MLLGTGVYAADLLISPLRRPPTGCFLLFPVRPGVGLSMLGRLVLLFLLTPAVELGLLIQVDRLIGFWPTIGLIIATGIAGSYLARREGLSTWKRLNERLRAGDLPGKELADGVIILVAGALLITPGVLTDAIGFLGLLPPTRALFRRMIIRRLQKKVREGSAQVQLGIFGSMSSGPMEPGPTPPSSDPSTSDANGRWEGEARRVPGHANDRTDPEDGNGTESSR